MEIQVRISRDRKVWNAAKIDKSQQIDLDAPLPCVKLVRKGGKAFAIACDGFILARVPCEIEIVDAGDLESLKQADVDAMVPYLIFKDAMRASVCTKDMASFRVKTVGEDGSVSYYSRKGDIEARYHIPQRQFPDYEAVINRLCEKSDPQSGFAVNPTLLKRACDAVGHPLRWTFGARGVSVYAGDAEDVGKSFAAVMLLHLK